MLLSITGMIMNVHIALCTGKDQESSQSHEIRKSRGEGKEPPVEECVNLIKAAIPPFQQRRRI